MHTSVRFSYSVTKKIDGIKGHGTTSWWHNRVMKFYGNAPESLCPTDNSLTDDEMIALPISIKAYLAAKELRVLYYQRLYTLNDCMHAIYTNGTCTFEFDIFESIRSAPKGWVSLPKIGEKHLGSHCCMFHGYSNKDDGEIKHFNFLNSWGEKWGDKGRGYLPFSYFEQGLVSSAWAHKLIIEKKEVEEKVYELKVGKKGTCKIVRNWYPSLRPLGNRMLVLDVYNSNQTLIIGCLHATPINDTEIEIEELFVLPQYQNSGYGKLLIKMFEQLAASYSFKKIYGWISAQDLVANREEGVVRFFKKNNYSITEDNSRFRDAVYKIEKMLE